MEGCRARLVDRDAAKGLPNVAQTARAVYTRPRPFATLYRITPRPRRVDLSPACTCRAGRLCPTCRKYHAIISAAISAPRWA